MRKEDLFKKKSAKANENTMITSTLYCQCVQQIQQLQQSPAFRL